MQSFARRAALAAGRRRGGCSSGKKGALPLVEQEARAQMHAPAPEEVAQVRPHGGLVGFTIGWTGPMFGIFIAHIALKFKPPPKTLEKLWLEALLREQESEANVG